MKTQIYLKSAVNITERPTEIEGVSAEADKFIRDNQDKIVEVELAKVKKWETFWYAITIHYIDEE
ncbi:hypothetical protein GZ22_16870 [Terribacillus saccharophilus]|uniref:Uncharacterized protein n=1 Tax=Terribacillus saccharophilus TaxID=361277 RepID=A0A075LUR8_9BACI|nr:hypothetical protein [Terribacillus goriensis]AIF68138.1 hypothetical protein GZ22_16870 [Terribacillus goriensis]